MELRAQRSKPSLESDSQEKIQDEVELERRCMLSSSESEQAPLKNNSEYPDNCARSDIEEANAFGTGKEVRKSFAGVG